MSSVHSPSSMMHAQGCSICVHTLYTARRPMVDMLPPARASVQEYYKGGASMDKSDFNHV
eukprot:390578-Amphidinium_carterae.1